MPDSKDANSLTDEQILILICSDDIAQQRKALKTFYWRWATPMKHFFVSKGCLPKDSEDLLQDVIVKIWRAASTFTGSGTATSWMWSVARNSLHDHQRKSLKYASDESLDLDNHDPGACETYNDELDDCIATGINRFSKSYPDRSHALELWSTGMEIQSIAEVLGRSYGATRQFLLECRKKMRPFLEPCFESELS